MRYNPPDGESLAYVTIVIEPPKRRNRRQEEQNDEDPDLSYFTQVGGSDFDSLVNAGIITSWLIMTAFGYLVAYDNNKFSRRYEFKRALKDHLTRRWNLRNGRITGSNASRYRIDPSRIQINVSYDPTWLNMINRVDRNAGVPIGVGNLLEARKRLVARALFPTENDKYVLHLQSRPEAKLKAKDLTPRLHNFIPRPGLSFDEAARAFLLDLYRVRRLFTSIRFFRVSPYTNTVFKSTKNLNIILGRDSENTFIRTFLPIMKKLLETPEEDEIGDDESEKFATMFGDEDVDHKLGIEAYRRVEGATREYTARIIFPRVCVNAHVIFDSVDKGQCMSRCLLYLAEKFNLGESAKKLFRHVKHLSVLKQYVQAYFFGDVSYLDGNDLSMRHFQDGALGGLTILRNGDHVKVVDKISSVVEPTKGGKEFARPQRGETKIFYDLETRGLNSYTRGKGTAETAYPVLCSWVIDDHDEVITFTSKQLEDVSERYSDDDFKLKRRYKNCGEYEGMQVKRKVLMIKKGLLPKKYVQGWLQRNFYIEQSYENCVDEFVKALADNNDEGGVIFAHNGGRFDHYFLLRGIQKYNNMNGGTNLPYYNCKGSQIIKLIWGNWILKDTFLFIPSSLKAAGKDFNVKETKTEFIHEIGMSATDLMLCRKELNPWEYLTYLHSQSVTVVENGKERKKTYYDFYREYCEQDVIALRELFRVFVEAVKGVIGKNYGTWDDTIYHKLSTLPSLAYEFFTRTLTYRQTPIKYTDEDGDPAEMSPHDFYKHYINVSHKDSQGLSQSQITRAAKGLIGGVSYASEGYYKNVACADIKSCYPWVMESDFKCPIGRHRSYTPKDMYLSGSMGDKFDFKKYGYGFAVASVWPDPTKEINRLAYRIPGQVMSWKRKEPWTSTLYPLYDIQDFLNRDKHGMVKIEKIYATKETVKFKEVFGVFVHILKTEKTRQDELKAAGSPEYNPSLRMCCKLILNALTGKMGQGAREYKTICVRGDGTQMERCQKPFANAQIGCNLLACARTLLFHFLDVIASPSRDNILKIETDSLTFFASNEMFRRIEKYCANKFGYLEVEFCANRLYVKGKKFSISHLAEIDGRKWKKTLDKDGNQITKIVTKGVHANNDQMEELRKGNDVIFNEKQFIVNRCGTLGIAPEISIVSSKLICIRGSGEEAKLVGYDYNTNRRYVIHKKT